MTDRRGAEASDERRRAPGRTVAPMTFIVRVGASETGAVGGVIEHAGTGRKERFDGVAAISDVIAALLKALTTDSHTGGTQR